MRDEWRPPHPGTTKAERRVLDAIGCGDYTAPMANRTREALLRKGLIQFIGMKRISHDGFGIIEVPEFQMPVHIHMQWCSAVASEDGDEDA